MNYHVIVKTLTAIGGSWRPSGVSTNGAALDTLLWLTRGLGIEPSR